MSYMDPEFWKDIPGSKVYQVSNYGNVRRKKKNGGYRPIKPFFMKGKWLYVKVDSEANTRYIPYITLLPQHSIYARQLLTSIYTIRISSNMIITLEIWNG